MTRPKTPNLKYNQRFPGVYGEFGTGANAKIYYLQTAISPVDLDKLKLIGSIKGSERWPVRDLFQRDVDQGRITKNLVPYFLSEDKVKFFNPITLTFILLSEENPGELISEIPKVNRGTCEEDGDTWNFCEVPGYYRYRTIPGSPQYSIVEWNDSKVYVVAIDGQHRLTALKRVSDDDTKPDFFNWSIPIVLFGLEKIEEDKPASLLGVIRNIFSYINTTAMTVNKFREILLSDEDPNCVFTQELIQISHDNDIALIDGSPSYNPDILPLLFYDWRGSEEGEKLIASPAAVKSVEEIKSWFEEYILGENFSDYQRDALEITPDDAILWPSFKDHSLAGVTHHKLRERFRQTVLPGITELLSEFTPYKQYISKIRDIELDHTSRSDLARHAFYKLRFGTHYCEDDAARDNIERQFSIVSEEVTAAKSELFTRELKENVGMRGVIYAYAWSKVVRDEVEEKTSDWEGHTKGFLGFLNRLYEDGFFYDEGPFREMKKNISYDVSGTIINYKIGDIEKGLGSMILLFWMHSADFPHSTSPEEYKDYAGTIATLRTTLIRGYTRDAKATHEDKLHDEFSGDRKKFNQFAKKVAETDSDKHLDRLKALCTSS